MHVELGARIGELGRQPRRAKRFFDEYQDRILFGTDAIPPPVGNETPQQIFSDELYEIYFRFLETEDEYFDYAPAPVPPQGRWRIDGLVGPGHRRRLRLLHVAREPRRHLGHGRGGERKRMIGLAPTTRLVLHQARRFSPGALEGIFSCPPARLRRETSPLKGEVHP